MKLACLKVILLPVLGFTSITFFNLYYEVGFALNPMALFQRRSAASTPFDLDLMILSVAKSSFLKQHSFCLSLSYCR